MSYFIHKVRFNQPTNKLEDQIQEFVQHLSCTTTENPQAIYEEVCKKVGELNEANKRCAYQVVQAHAHDWEKQPHSITIASHKKSWDTAHTHIVFDEIKNSPTEQGLFTCKGCSCELTKDYVLRTEGYCYLCDPNIKLSELLPENKLEENQDCHANCEHCNALAEYDDSQKFDEPLWALMKALNMFSMRLLDARTEDVGVANPYEHQKAVFGMFEDANYYFLKWKNDCNRDVLNFAGYLNDEELMLIYRAYEPELRSQFIFY